MARPYQRAAEEVLGAAALMRGHHIPVAVVMTYR